MLILYSSSNTMHCTYVCAAVDFVTLKQQKSCKQKTTTKAQRNKTQISELPTTRHSVDLVQSPVFFITVVMAIQKSIGKSKF